MEAGGWATGAVAGGEPGVWIVRAALNLQSRRSPVPLRKEGPDWARGPKEMKNGGRVLFRGPWRQAEHLQRQVLARELSKMTC